MVFMAQWVIYDRPTDFPDGVIARLWLVGAKNIVPTREVVTCLYNDNAVSRESVMGAIRLAVQEKLPGAVCMGREPDDDPKIVEVWL